MPQPDGFRRPDTLDGVSANTSPHVTEVLRFEDLPIGSRGSRRAVVRWSDGSEGEALTWYAIYGYAEIQDPHKSAYAETCATPRDPRGSRQGAGDELETSA